MSFISKHKYTLATFLMSFIIMTLAFAKAKMFPFGDNQIMIIDSWHQYYPFLQELHHKLTHGESLFYSWNIGGGSNFMAVMAYYAMSPLNLLSILFPKEYLREFMLFVTILKISLAGAFFSVYLRGVFGKNDISIMIFGLMYAFCGYGVGYYWNIMWLDCFALLPLIILGLHQLLDEEGYLVYTVSLALAVISSFYIGYFICEFIALYFFILYFSRYSWKGIPHLIDKMIHVGAYSLLAIGISAVVLIPAFKGLQLAYGLSSANPSALKTYYTLMDIFNNLLANGTPSIKSGLPNIYSGLFSLLMGMFYFMTPSIPIRKKLLNLFLLSFFFFSFNINYLDFVWHGFHFPNEVPYRYAFMMSFVLITLAYQAYEALHEIEAPGVWRVTAGFLVYLAISEKVSTQFFNYRVFYVSMLLVVIYGGLILLQKHQRLSSSTFAGILCYVIIGEMLLSAINGTTAAGSSGRTGYPALNESVQEAIAKLYDMDKDFYRMDMLMWYSTNDPTLYGYRGVSQFSSTVNSKITAYAQRLGLSATPDSNRYLYASQTPIGNGLLGIKYLIGKNGAGAAPNSAYEPMDSGQDVNIYRVKYPLPLGFMTKSSLDSWDMASTNPFEVQERFLSSAAGKTVKVFNPLPLSGEAYTNMTRTGQDGIRYYYNNQDPSKVGRANLTFVAPERKQIYAYLYANQSYQADVVIGGNSTRYDTRRGLLIDLGILEQGQNVELSFEVFAGSNGLFDLQVVSFDEAAYGRVYPELSDEPLEVEAFTDTGITGTVEAREDGILYTSIPYEKGWTALVNGEKVKIEPINNAMITLPLPAGTHRVEFRYTPAGFAMGMGVSVASMAVLIGLYLHSRRKMKPAVPGKPLGRSQKMA